MTHLMRRMENGYPLLQASAINKGDAFTQIERDARGLQGLLPPAVKTMAQQVQRGKFDRLRCLWQAHLSRSFFGKLTSEGLTRFVQNPAAQVSDADGASGRQRNCLLQVTIRVDDT